MNFVHYLHFYLVEQAGEVGYLQPEPEAEEEEAEPGEDDEGLEHPQQPEHDALVQEPEEVDARQPAPPLPQRRGQRAHAQQRPAPGRRRHLLPYPLPLPPAGHRWRSIDLQVAGGIRGFSSSSGSEEHTSELQSR